MGMLGSGGLPEQPSTGWLGGAFAGCPAQSSADPTMATASIGSSSSSSSWVGSVGRPAHKRIRDDLPEVRQCAGRRDDDYEMMMAGPADGSAFNGYSGACSTAGSFTQPQKRIDSGVDEAMGTSPPWAPPASNPSFHPFTSSFSGTTCSHPDVDVIRKAGHYEVQLDLPGARREQVALQLRQRVLHVAVAAPTGRPHSAAFVTTVRLPHDVDAWRVCADMSHGLLRLRLPRGAAGPAGYEPSSHLSVRSNSASDLATLGGSQPVYIEYLG